MNKIKYAIADDHKIFRTGIIAALANTPELQLVLEAENGKVLLEGLTKNKPDVILLDIKMPEMDGIETVKELRKKIEHVIQNTSDEYWQSALDSETGIAQLVKDLKINTSNH